MAWGPIIALYLFAAGVASGAFLASALIEIKYPECRKMRVAGRIIAPIFMGLGLVVLIVDAEAGLHNPLRFMYLVMNPTSIMTLGVYFISIFMPIACIVAILEILKKSVPKWLVYIGAVTALVVAGYTGFLLGVVPTVPLWNNSLLPVLFTISGLSAGLSAVVLAGLLLDREHCQHMTFLKKIHLILSANELIVLFTMLTIVASGGSSGAESVFMLLTGDYAIAFWIGVVAVGIVFPLIVESAHVFLTKNHTPSQASYAVSILVEVAVLAGVLMLRLLIVVAAVPISIV